MPLFPLAVFRPSGLVLKNYDSLVLTIQKNSDLLGYLSASSGN